MKSPSVRSRRQLAGVVAVGVAGVLVGFSLSPTGSTAAPSAGSRPGPTKAKSVIFINGDGMSAAHREAARLALAGLDGKLQMDSLPDGGTLTTDARDPAAYVTDSAAAATAWATGQKTYNGAISVDVNQNPLPILGRQAKQAGKSTGLVTTAQVTDASPAAWFSQTANRSNQDDIARQYLEYSKPDVILGGGEDWWYPAGTEGAYPDHPAKDPTEASKGTKGNLVDEATSLGYDHVSTADELAASRSKKLLGLFANEEMFEQRPEGQGDVYDPTVSLASMTRKALDTLSTHKKGFFLFVEEEGVDEFAHNNNGQKVLDSMKALEAAVAVARAYVDDHPDTLLVITGDHDCGGLTVEDTGTSDESGTGVAPDISKEDGPFAIKGSDKQFVMDWTTSGHTDAPVPVTAQGPGADRFGGQHPNTFVHDVLAPILTRR
jgi:alkaline phosphatase